MNPRKTKKDSQTKKTGSSRINTLKWLPEEHQKFIEGLRKYGDDYGKIADVVGTRTASQVRSHNQKYQLKQLKKKEKERDLIICSDGNPQITTRRKTKQNDLEATFGDSLMPTNSVPKVIIPQFQNYRHNPRHSQFNSYFATNVLLFSGNPEPQMLDCKRQNRNTNLNQIEEKRIHYNNKCL